MSLLTPDSGLLFWMLISFGVVFFILAKFGFPVITKMVEDRKNYVQGELDAAKEAKLQLKNLQAEGAKILAEAQSQQVQLLKDGAEMRDKLIEEARSAAQVEADKVMQAAHLSIQKEKEEAIKEIKTRIADLSVEIAEKILRKNLDNKPAQMELIDKMLDEATNN